MFYHFELYEIILQPQPLIRDAHNTFFKKGTTEKVLGGFLIGYPPMTLIKNHQYINKKPILLF